MVRDFIMRIRGKLGRYLSKRKQRGQLFGFIAGCVAVKTVDYVGRNETSPSTCTHEQKKDMHMQEGGERSVPLLFVPSICPYPRSIVFNLVCTAESLAKSCKHTESFLNLARVIVVGESGDHLF